MDLATEIRRAPAQGLSTRVIAAWVGCLFVACSSGDEAPQGPVSCSASLDAECSPLYEPTFSEIHRRTLVTTCAEPGTACHSSQGQRGNLDLEDIERAYESLMDPEYRRVIPGDPACSLLMVRLNHPGRSVMPPGAPLSEAARCTIAAWIREGAAR